MRLLDAPAIDAGDNNVGLLFDQRGEPFDRIVDWDGDLVDWVEMGAVELALGELYS